MDVYMYYLKVNGHPLAKLRIVAKISDGNFEFIYIDSNKTGEVLLKELSVIDIEFEEVFESYELKWYQKIQIVCNVDEETYTVNAESEM